MSSRNIIEVVSPQMAFRLVLVLCLAWMWADGVDGGRVHLIPASYSYTKKSYKPRRIAEGHWQIGHTEIKLFPKEMSVKVMKGRNTKLLSIDVYSPNDDFEGALEHYPLSLHSPMDTSLAAIRENSVIGICLNKDPKKSLGALVEAQYKLIQDGPKRLSPVPLPKGSPGSRRRRSFELKNKDNIWSKNRLHFNPPEILEEHETESLQSSIHNSSENSGIFSKKEKRTFSPTSVDLTGLGDWCMIWYIISNPGGPANQLSFGSSNSDEDVLKPKKAIHGSNLSTAFSIQSLSTELKNEKLAFEVFFDQTADHLMNKVPKGPLTTMDVEGIHMVMNGSKLHIHTAIQRGAQIPYSYVILEEGTLSLKDSYEGGIGLQNIKSRSFDSLFAELSMAESSFMKETVSWEDAAIETSRTAPGEPDIDSGDFVAIAWGADNPLATSPSMLFRDAVAAFSFTGTPRGQFIIIKTIPWGIPEDSTSHSRSHSMETFTSTFLKGKD